MDKNDIEKKLICRMRLQFCTIALTCLAFIAAISLLAVFLQNEMLQKQTKIPKEPYAPEAAELIARIDDIRIGRSQKETPDELINAYNRLPGRLKEQVGAQRLAKLSEAASLQEALEPNGGLTAVDKGTNGYHLKLGQGSASLKRYGGRIAFEGQAEVLASGGTDALDGLFSGSRSFTVEAVINPNDSGYYNTAEPNDPDNYNMIASKGDHCMGLRISEQSLQFFIWSNRMQWMNVKMDLTKQQLHSWIHVAGIYDGKNAMVYLEGSGIRTLQNVGETVSSKYPFSIGYCPETGRASSVAIQSIRVYDRALTAEELDAGKTDPQDGHVALWYDFSKLECPGLDMQAKGIRTYAAAVHLKEQQEMELPVDPIPYYAAGELVFETDNPQAAMVSQTGVVTGMAEGTAMVTASVKGTDFSVDIPVRVGDVPISFTDVLGWFVNRIVWVDLVVFAFCLCLIAAWQRRQMVFCVAGLSFAIGSLGESEEEIVFPPILGETQALLLRAQERFRQKDMTVREAERKKNELMAYLAHDLKTPIASTVGYLTLLRDEEQISPEARRHYAKIALNSAQRLDELIEEFFEITRFNMSHIELEYQEINLTWLLEQLISEFEPMLAEKGLSCRLEIERDIRLRCDPDKMERVFDNLIRNAINYSYCNTEIRITVQGGESLEITCENQGDTISQDKLARIFEQLYRIDYARSSDTGGSGLGLAIAKQIVELHQGKIYAASKNNKICFTVIIPRQ